MAGASPKTIPVTRASASVKPSTCQFRLACRVKLSCPLASSQVIDWMPQYATSNPSSAPTKESITLSVSNWRHKDWLVHNAKGEPIQVTTDEEVRSEKVFALDCTNPAAQEFLRQTYRTLVLEWQVKYIKLDFMDTTAIEGYFYRPHTTALDNLRTGLQII